MHWAIPNFSIPEGNPPQEFELLMIGSFKSPPPGAKIAFKYPTLVPDLMANVSPMDV